GHRALSEHKTLSVSWSHYPSVNTGTYNRNGFSIHSCLNAFGPSLGPRFCSEGCITGLSNDMQKLNELIFSEPDSTLTVTD
ncbi:hypothetical protein DW258_25180, partial [Escherichia coli]